MGTELQLANPKFGVPTKLLQAKVDLPIRLDTDQSSYTNAIESGQKSAQVDSNPNSNLTANVSMSSAEKQMNPNSVKFGSTSEMRAFESATIETTASSNGKETNNNNNNNSDDLDDEDSSDTSNASGITTTEAPSEDPPNLNSRQQQQQQANSMSEKVAIKNSLNSEDKNLIKPIKVANVKQQANTKSFKATHHELLVGPFKSESDAPDTITLAGVVYQKSGSSSGLPALFAAGNAKQPSQANLAASSTRSIETTSLTQPNGLGLHIGIKPDALRMINIENNSKYSRPQSVNVNFQASKLIGANSQQQQQMTKHVNSVAQQWTPQALPSNTQLFLPISQAQLISLLGQPAKLLTSASQTIAQAAAAKAKDKSKVSVTLTSIPTGESLLSSLASSLDFKLANPTNDNNAKSQSASSISQAIASASNSNGEPTDWSSSASSPTATQTTISGSSTGTQNNDATMEQLYLNSLLQGIGSTSQLESMVVAASSTSKDHMKSAPVVIVEKNVKPVKYHLLRAYLKLRRLLRPSDATYVFPASSLKHKRNSMRK